MKAGGIAVALTVLAVSLAYQLPATLELDLGKSFPSALLIDDFHDAEGRYRWTRARSLIVFRDPGASRSARVELELSGFRPPGQTEPLVLVGAGADSLRLRASRAVSAHALETRTTGLWSSDLEVELRSETFIPGSGDERSLGVRVHRARLVLDAGTIPPVRQLLLSALLVSLLLVLTGSAPAAAATGIVISLGYALFRVQATLFVPLLAAFLVVLALTRWLVPSAERFSRDVIRDSARRTLTSSRELWSKPVALVLLAGLVGVFVCYRITPRLTFDLGSGRAAPLARRFAAFDRSGEVTFQRALAGASLDLRDFGAGALWTIGVRASASREEVRATLLSAGNVSLETTVSDEWETFSIELPAPSWGWRAGEVLSFPGLGRGVTLSVDRVDVDRGKSLPPLKPVLLILGASLITIAAFRSTGSSMRAAVLAGALFLAATLLGLALDPVLVIPFLPTIFLATVSAFLLAASSTAFLTRLAERGWLPEAPPLALGLAVTGFVLSFVATASPLYVGGHYGFHTAIAEEIWQGQFLRYYLPYPGSMLSRQPQWDHLIVPHSCLYHAVTSPFAAFPRFWLGILTKLFLAWMVFAIAAASALVATRVRAGPAGIYAALAAALLPTAYQLLGLGHLMTLFGAWASAIALGFLVIHVDRLSERPIFWCSLALLTLCFLSYTGSLLFASLALIAACALLYRGHRDLVKRLATLVGLAWAVSFLLYYVHWAWPFVSESVPALLAGSGSDARVALGSRLQAQPGKLAYTFGSAVVPLLGLVGLAQAESRERRALLYCWGSILVGFSLLDIAFNFLLKHHYFTYPVVAVGLGLALGWAHEKNRLGRMITGLLVVSIVWMGFREALTVASGGV